MGGRLVVSWATEVCKGIAEDVCHFGWFSRRRVLLFEA